MCLCKPDISLICCLFTFTVFSIVSIKLATLGNCGLVIICLVVLPSYALGIRTLGRRIEQSVTKDFRNAELLQEVREANDAMEMQGRLARSYRKSHPRQLQIAFNKPEDAKKKMVPDLDLGCLPVSQPTVPEFAAQAESPLQSIKAKLNRVVDRLPACLPASFQFYCYLQVVPKAYQILVRVLRCLAWMGSRL